MLIKNSLPLLLISFVIWATATSTQAGTYEAPRARRVSSNVSFAAPPKVKVNKNGSFEISFEASAPSDAEVAILGANDQVVRHLAAGLLGSSAPLPFIPGKLAQKLTWNRKDDLGRMLPADKKALGYRGPYKVRVRLGSKPKLVKHIGRGNVISGPISSIKVGDKGELYVLTRSWVKGGRNEIMVFDREGKYLRTIMPYSAKVPEDRLRSLGRLDFDGRKVPVVFNGHSMALSPLTVTLPHQRMAWNHKGYLVLASSKETASEHGLPRHLLAIDSQGGAPQGMKFVGPELSPPTGITWGHGEGDDPCFDNMAASADGKWIYYTHSSFYNLHAVYRLAWGEAKGSGVEAGWLGLDNRPGSDQKHLNDPCGLDVDKDGNLYVCDRGNNRVLIVSPQAKRLGSFMVRDPEQISVHRKTGEIYLLCRPAPSGAAPKDTGPMSMKEYRAWKQRVAARKELLPPARKTYLRKFSAWEKGKTPKELIKLQEKIKKMTLDSDSSPAQLWVVGRGGLRALKDAGDKFESGEAIGKGTGLYHPAQVVGDLDRDRVLVYSLSSNYKIRKVDLKSGKVSTFMKGVSDFDIAPDGSIYGSGPYNSNKLLRFNSEGKPLNFKGTDSNSVKTPSFWVGGVNLGFRGMTIAPSGDIYMIRVNMEKGLQGRVDVFGPDGKRKKSALVDNTGQGDCGIGVDPAGNIYLGVNVKPRNAVLPVEFRTQVPPPNWLCWAVWSWNYRPAPWYYSMRNEYLFHMGSVMKFGPKGGQFYGRGSGEYTQLKNPSPLRNVENAPAGATAYRSGYLYRDVKVVGAKWRYPGVGIIPASERLWGDPSCVCITSRFSVDLFGRVYAPNCFGSCVEMIDSNGNLITRIGKYGNADDNGLQFAWPAFMDKQRDHLFVTDSVNRRVTVVKFEYAAEQTLSLQ
jgi:NHL repeat